MERRPSHLVRRTANLIQRIRQALFSAMRKMAFKLHNENITLGASVGVDRNVRLSCTDGGELSVASDSYLHSNAELICRGGRMQIGEHVNIGRGSMIVCIDQIQIGDNTQIAEYVVIRDQDHATDVRPIRNAGFKTSPITIGRDCWLGAKVTVLRGSTIGDGAVVGAHSVVRGDIPPNTLAVGCPARVVKRLAVQ